MSIDDTPRARPDNHGPHPRKRRKIQDAAASGPDGDVLVDAGDLKWQTVTLPERLADAEGFYGLEEIDDVEVIKTSDGKNLRFKPPQSNGVFKESVGDPSGGRVDWFRRRDRKS